MANWWEAIELEVTAEDWAWATAVAEFSRTRPSLGHSSFWSQFERDRYGRVCEAAFARYAGVRHLLPEPHDIIGHADLPGLSTTVKGMPWRNVEDFHLCYGGRMTVARHQFNWAPVWAGCTFFASSRRVFFDGWTTVSELRRATATRNKNGNTGAPAVSMPYRDLRPPLTWCPNGVPA